MFVSFRRFVNYLVGQFSVALEAERREADVQLRPRGRAREHRRQPAFRLHGFDCTAFHDLSVSHFLE